MLNTLCSVLPAQQQKNNISYTIDTAAVKQLLSEQTSEGIIYICIGSICIVLAAIFLMIIRYSYFKGMAVPLLTLGVVELVEGIASLFHNLDQTVEKVLAENLQSLFLTRIFLYSSIAGIMLGILLYTRFYNSRNVFYKGLGLTLLIQCFILMGIFSLKENRLNRFNKACIETKHPH